MRPSFRREIRPVVLWILAIRLPAFPVRGYHPLERCFPADFLYASWARHESEHHIGVSLQHPFGLSCSLFTRRYWGNRYCFLFLPVIRCFNSGRSPSQRDLRLVVN